MKAIESLSCSSERLSCPCRLPARNLDEPIPLRSATAKALIDFFGWMYAFSKLPYSRLLGQVALKPFGDLLTQVVNDKRRLLQ